MLDDDDDENDPWLKGQTASGDADEENVGNFPVPRVSESADLLRSCKGGGGGGAAEQVWSFDLLELARQWTLLDHRAFCAVSLSSLQGCS